MKTWIEDAFSGQLDVFLSSDPKDLASGQKWLDDIHSRLRASDFKIMVSLISSRSMSRPWISIELGAAWVLDRMVIPFCHSGTGKDSLPRPLSILRPLSLNDPTAVDF